MKALKRYWYLFLLTIITVGLGAMTFITSQQLTKTTPVAPNVPQATPKAAAPACTLQIALATTVTNTPTNTPINTPTNTPTPTPRPSASCNNGCAVNADCASGLVCDGGACRNPSCTAKTNCVCDVGPTPTPTPVLASCNNTCTVNTDCKSGLVCLENTCRNPSCTEKTNCTCEVAVTTPTPKVPVAGTGPSVLGASTIGASLLLILLGLLF